MRTKINDLNLETNITDLSGVDLVTINGGQFAYDFGFFLRECFICIANGGGPAGISAAALDFGINYKSVH